MTARSIRNILNISSVSGLSTNMQRSEYRLIQGMNPSSLSEGLVGVSEIDVRAIKDAFEADEKPRAQAAQDAMNRGTLAHLALLQPELLLDRVAVWSGAKRASAEWDAFEHEHQGKLILRRTDYEETMEAVNEMRSQPLVSDYLRDISPEVAMISTESASGIEVQVRGQVDAVRFDDHVIVDIKTTERGIDRRSVENTIRYLHYREKMALYRRWVARLTDTDPLDWRCYNLFLGMGDHRGIRLMKMGSDALEFGECRMMDAIRAVCESLKANSWPMFQRDDVMSVAPWEIDDGEGAIDYDE